MDPLGERERVRFGKKNRQIFQIWLEEDLSPKDATQMMLILLILLLYHVFLVILEEWNVCKMSFSNLLGVGVVVDQK